MEPTGDAFKIFYTRYSFASEKYGNYIIFNATWKNTDKYYKTRVLGIVYPTLLRVRNEKTI